MAASRPVTCPVAPPGVVGKAKSMVNMSWWLRISTISRWSIQNSSTDSRLNSPKPPHSCMVRAPRVMAPGCSGDSAARPPATAKRMVPLWGSLGMDLRFTAMPFCRRRCMTPVLGSQIPRVAPGTPQPGGTLGTNSTNSGGYRSAAACSSSIVKRVSGTGMSTMGSMSVAMARRMTSRTASALSWNGRPLRSRPGAQAMIAEGTTPDVGSGPDRCSHSSRQMPFTSSSVMEVRASFVTRRESSGCMKAWPTAVASMIHWTTFSLSSSPDWAASISDSARMALL
mmetsp:Transcript_71680/g.126194  ORF Transcript_71680/g.126194 Transcript_71680/m.126194 type:complete len:283 (-) Transcript_71680:1901-2749(-)